MRAKDDAFSKSEHKGPPGLTKREYIATMAMSAFITGTFTDTGGQCVGITGSDGRTENATPDIIANYAVEYADALIKELSKDNT